MFQEALARCERGESGGIIVARLDRFARSAVDALEAIKRLNEAGARLVSVEDNFDGSTPMGRFAIGILTLIAELELERITENWDTAVSEAVKRGVHISARAPVGYRKLGKGQGLEPVEPAASVVAEVFRRRAVGASYSELARFLEEESVFPSTGNPRWSSNGVRTLLKNRVYLGEARSGKLVNPTAHTPIVTRAEFDAAQAAHSVFEGPKDALASQALVKGLARCAGCGHTLKVTGTYLHSLERRVPTYYCHGRYAKGLCPARAAIISTRLDPYVETTVQAALTEEGGLLAEAMEASAEIEAAQRAVDEAEHELDLYIEADLVSVVGRDTFTRGVEARQQRLDETRATLKRLQQQSEFGEELLTGDLVDAWPTLTIPEKRLLLHGLIDQIVVERAEGRGRATQPVESRVSIILRGGTTLRSNVS
jgi:DNA invertase Pin-like site-specific DNA recombinase